MSSVVPIYWSSVLFISTLARSALLGTDSCSVARLPHIQLSTMHSQETWSRFNVEHAKSKFRPTGLSTRSTTYMPTHVLYIAGGSVKRHLLWDTQLQKYLPSEPGEADLVTRVRPNGPRKVMPCVLSL
jgi:hypothetical protein